MIALLGLSFFAASTSLLGKMSDGFQPPLVYFLARQHGLAYLQMPKVACSSFRTALILLDHPDLSREALSEPGSLVKHPEWSDMAEPDSPVLQSCLRFTFVRDPIARFVSFYRSKIARVDGQGTRPRFVRMGFSAEMSMADVLDRLEDTAPAELDSHAAPQSAFVLHRGCLQVDFIGRLERLADDVRLIEARAGTTLELPHRNQTINARPADARAQLPGKLRERLVDFYSADFTLLGYEP